MLNRQEYPSLRQGLVGAWCPSLGASGLSLIDRSGRGSRGTLVAPSSNTWTASGSGVALAFDGSTQYASLPFSATFGASATLAMWVKRDSETPSTLANSGIIETDSTQLRATHYPYTDGICYFAVFRLIANRVSFSPLASVARTKWHSVVVTTDGTTYSVYQNGLVAYSGSAQSTVTISSPLLPAASNANGSLVYFGGQMDDIRLYNRALTLAEVRLLASRRGIGLSPLPDRTAGLPRKLYVNVGGTWRSADAYVNVGGSWKLAQASVNVGGTWK